MDCFEAAVAVCPNRQQKKDELDQFSTTLIAGLGCNKLNDGR